MQLSRISEEIEQRKAAIIAEFLAELVDIPEVTVEDVADLNAALAVRGETTQIIPMPAFRAARAKTSRVYFFGDDPTDMANNGWFWV